MEFDLNLFELIIQLFHEQSTNSVLILLTAGKLLLLRLLQLLKKTALGFEFVHIISAKFTSEAFIADIARSGAFLINLGHFKVSASLGAKHGSHWAGVLQMANVITKRYFLPVDAAINTPEY